jgi:GntR family uxuAB operon transcriptional repressor
MADDPLAWLQRQAPHRAYQQVALRIVDIIRSGEFRAGDCLPPERELAGRLSVGRNVLREAMIALELAGLVEVRVGAGTFVLAANERPDHFDLQRLEDQGPGPFELCMARRLIEGNVAALAAKARSKADVEKLRDFVMKLESLASAPYEVKDSWDRRFHVGIAESTGNMVLASVVESLYRVMDGAMFTRLSSHVRLHDLELTVREHRMILACLEAGDPEAARAAMEQHMDNVAMRLSKPLGRRNGG